EHESTSVGLMLGLAASYRGTMEPAISKGYAVAAGTALGLVGLGEIHIISGQEMVSANDEDAIADLMDQRDQFMGSMQSRLTKLQVF
ncbi:hypothetical protein FRX31_014595, partial [Thalictrum thalictroides]